jgi:hypothetical protein
MAISTLQWTEKKPTEEGWYWIKRKNSLGEFESPKIDYVRDYVGEMCILNWPVPDGKWAGPIPEPISYIDVDEYYKD